jgi:hypothetical protein
VCAVLLFSTGRPAGSDESDSEIRTPDSQDTP